MSKAATRSRRRSARASTRSATHDRARDRLRAGRQCGAGAVRAEVNGGAGTFARLFRKQPLVSRVSDLEYRTCAAASRAEAKTAAHRLLGLRQTAWRRRMDAGWAARSAELNISKD